MLEVDGKVWELNCESNLKASKLGFFLGGFGLSSIWESGLGDLFEENIIVVISIGNTAGLDPVFPPAKKCILWK